MSGVSLAPWEVEVIETLDNLFLAQQGKELKEQIESSQKNGNKGR